MASSSAQAEISPLEELASLEDAQEKLREGWACAQTDDLETAIELLGEALSLRIEHFGEMAPECATAYYKYGCALFWKAQQETDVLGEPMSKIRKQQEEKADPTGKGKAHVEEEDEDEDEGGEEEETDMELAWKLLETARLIHEKQPGHTVEEADVISCLADISTEREDFETAVKDYGQALSILEGLLQVDDRMLAEVCFKMSLAYQLWQQAGPAAEYINRAVATCEKRIARLQSLLETQPVGKGKELEGAKNEIGAGKQAVTEGKELEGAENGNGKEAVTEGKERSEKAGGKEVAADVSVDREKAKKEIGDVEALLVDLREKADELREFAKHPTLAALQSDRPAASSATPVESSSFDAPQLSASASAPPITNLGVVGRGSLRITPSPAPREATLVVPKKRTMEDMMGGGADVSIGFGSSGNGVSNGFGSAGSGSSIGFGSSGIGVSHGFSAIGVGVRAQGGTNGVGLQGTGRKEDGSVSVKGATENPVQALGTGPTEPSKKLKTEETKGEGQANGAAEK